MSSHDTIIDRGIGHRADDISADISERSTVAPFPFEALPAVSKQEIEASARFRDATAGLFRTDVVAKTIAELTGETISIVLRRTRSLDSTHIPSDAVGVAFAPSDAPEMAHAFLIDVESALASVLVARALRQRAPRVVSSAQLPPPEIAGALGALVHTVLRRAHAGTSFRVVAAGPAQALARDLALGNERRVVTAWLTLFVGEDAFDARVSVRLDAMPRMRRQTLSTDDLLAIDSAPIALPLVVATCSASRHEILALRRGDVFVVPNFQMNCASDSGELTGPIAIVTSKGERGIGGDLTANGRLVLRTERSENHSWDARHAWGRKDSMTTPESESESEKGAAQQKGAAATTATLDVLEDAPLVVRVELGVVEMKAREWAALSNGDVITLGRKLGDPATLRVGGVNVAYGEIVQVDGEYGVRILGRPTRGQ